MSNLSVYERKNTIKTEVDFQSGGSPTDPSGSKAFVQVIKPDGTYLVGNSAIGSGASRTGVGTYEYYFNTSPTDPLGIYVINWYGYHDLGTIDSVYYGFKKISQRDAIQVVDTD